MTASSRRTITIALLLLGTACRNGITVDPDVPTTTVRSELDFPTGDIGGRVLWQGAPASGLGTRAMRVSAPGLQFQNVLSDASFSFPAVAPGNYDVGVFPGFCFTTTARLGGVSATVSAGTVTSADIDITGTAGRLIARVTTNGTPVSSPIVRVTGVCETMIAVSDSNGNVSNFFPPGRHRAEIWDNSGLLGTFDFTIVAGEVTDLGTLDLPTGGIAGVVRWQGTPVTGLGTTALLAELVGVNSRSLLPDGTFSFPTLAPRSYDINLFGDGCTGEDHDRLGGTSVIVSPGAVTVADIDITDSVGRLAGRITLNGAPLPLPELRFSNICRTFADRSSDNDGNFSTFLVPGQYTVEVWTPIGTRVGSLTFTITAGQVTDLGTVDLATGGLAGVVRWHGDPITGLGSTAMVARVVGMDIQQFEDDASFSFPALPPGNHEVQIFSGTCNAPTSARLGSVTAPVTAGAVTTADVDITATAGRLVGRISMNGAPVPFPHVRVSSICSVSGELTSDSEGNFSLFVPPGVRSAEVRSNAGIIGTFSFAIVAGQVTNVDDLTTPVGTNVKTILNGGLGVVGGMEVTFSTVTNAGNTTLVVSGTGPAPATGYKIVGHDGVERWWDLHTSATYTGLIRVCLHYDPNDVTGNEAALALHHDDGTGFREVLNMMVDNEADVVCGDVTSLSPFVVVEPIASDNSPPVFGTFPSTVVAYATGTNGALVNYTLPTATDEVSGPASVTCTPASGSRFPVGQSTVTCSASDALGNPATATFTVWVQYEAPAGGAFFLKPIRPDGSSVFRVGRPVPVKFNLTGASTGITDLVARLTVTRISDQVRGKDDCESDEDGDETDFLFKYRPAKGIYAARWKTRGESPGTYSLTAELGDGVVHQINVSLRRAGK